MRFRIGQAFEFADKARRAVVAGTRSEGREGLLRFTDTGAEEWHLWAEFHKAGEWRLLGGPE
jgi:hypothetical protein